MITNVVISHYTCEVCGAKALPISPEKRELPVNIDELRTKWLKAAEHHTPVKEDEMGANVVRTSIAYFGSFPPHTATLPDSMTTVETERGFKLVCKTCTKDKKT